MSKRPRDIGRKYLSGSKKRALAKAEDEKERCPRQLSLKKHIR